MKLSTALILTTLFLSTVNGLAQINRAEGGGSAPSPDDFDIEYVGSTLWTIVKDIVVEGDYAYCAFFNGLVILDISDTTNPGFVGSVFLQRPARGIFKSGDFVYIANALDGLKIINVADPFNPTVVGSQDTPGSAADIYVQNDYAYISDWYDGGLQIIDVTFPSYPCPVGSFDTPGSAEKIFVIDTLALVADGYQGVKIFDVSDPSNPIPLGSYNSAGQAVSIFVQDSLAYVAVYDSGLVILNIVDPTNPDSIGSYNTSSYAKDVAVQGDMAYISDGNDGLQIIDVTDPTNPQLVSNQPSPGASDGIFVRNNLVYIAARYSGVQIIDVTDPGLPYHIGFYDTEFSVGNLFVKDTLVYIPDYFFPSLHIVNVVDPANPQIIGRYENALCCGEDVFVQNDLAFFAQGNIGLQIIDVSDPTDPVRIGEGNTMGYARSVFIQDNLAFIADGFNGGLQIIDISDPFTPDSVGGYDTPGGGRAVFVLNDLAYIADGYSGLQIIDVSEPSNPLFVGEYVTPDHAQDIIVHDSLAFVPLLNYGLLIINVVDPANPDSFSSYYNPPNGAYSIYLQDSLAYLAENTNTSIINVADPTNPVSIGNYTTPGGGGYIHPQDSLIYVADGASFIILKTSIKPPSSEIHVTNLDDTGEGSLRWAISQADNNIGRDTIVFDVSGTIEITSAPLPHFGSGDPIYLLGSTAPGGTHSIVLDGSALAVGDGIGIDNPGNYIEGLVITGFPGNGIMVDDNDSVISNTFTNNLIYDNGLLGIDLGGDGVTANDSADIDTGPNTLINFPEIDSAASRMDESYDIYGHAAADARLEFFVAHPAEDSSRPIDPTNHGEAYEFLGFTVTSPTGEFTFPLEMDNGHFSIISATTTDESGNTSEFSINVILKPAPLLVVAYGPVNVIIEDPDNLLFGWDSLGNLIDEISPADYFETPNDSVLIYDPKLGIYTVYFVREAGIPKPEPTYAAIIKVDGTQQAAINVDTEVPASGQMDSYNYNYEEGFHYVNGDANGDYLINVADAVFLINYVFKNGPPPDPLSSGDANCDTGVNVADAVKIINYVFKDGDPPCFLEL